MISLPPIASNVLIFFVACLVVLPCGAASLFFYLRYKAAEKQVASLKNILESIGQGIVAVDADGCVAYANQAWADMHGQVRDEIVGWHIKRFHSEEQFKQEVRPFTEIVARKGSHSCEISHIRADGTPFPTHMTASLQKDADDQSDGFIGVAADISEQKKVEDALRASEIKFRHLFSLSPEPITVSDLTGRIYEVNEKFCRLTGYSRRRVIGKTALDLGFTPEKWQQIIHALTTEGEVAGHEIDFYAENQQKHHMLIFAKLIEIKDEFVVLSVLHDITEQRRLEDRLRESQKLEAIGTLAGGIAHDFNNILSAILGYVELSMLKTDRNHKVFSYLDQVLKAANRAKDLVRQILSVSRQSEQQNKPVHVQPVVEDVLKLMRASLPSSVEIREQIDRQTGPIMADTGQIHQVLMNLCTNAGQSMNEGGGTLTVGLDTVKIGPADISPDFDISPGAYARITVCDTGHGMSADVEKRIFDPYFTTKVKGMGTGLGLAVVQGIVKKQGGTVTVSSKIGEGTEFAIYLPIIQKIGAEEKEAPASIAPEDVPGGDEKILLVDDEAAIVDTGQQMLEHLGYTVRACANSSEALSAFREQPDKYDLVITDMTMPDMTGDELSRQIMAIRADIPVLLCTGYNPRIDKQSARAMGIKAFVFKPINLKNLAATIRGVLDDPAGSQSATRADSPVSTSGEQ
ncbi:MAG: PAS domain-containing hybrid sensor histidine kinase/response regulator [Thermodesulfobacteriota bacterium]